ncbi:hypothetical protein ACFQH5_20350 [Halomonas salifodinae]|uniref:NinB protein n=1 Tax=Halomonas salifodinae TaxID=438745 RepID=A0ABW2F469_9GAMM
MSKELVIPVASPADYSPAIERVKSAATKGVQGGRPFEIAIRYPSKSRIQEEKYHAMIHDIHRQCFRGYSAEGVKAVLVNQFAREMEEAGTPLAHPGERVWDWQTQEPVYVRPSTKGFLKSEASQFVEFLYSVGTEYGVAWSDKAMKAYEEYREVAA